MYANRLNKLGTETAFSVSYDAAKFESAGNIVYPYHLGDINFPTPKNIIEATKKAMTDNKTGYNPASGIDELRSIIADIIGNERKIGLNLNNVVVQPGGKPVISKFIQALMNPGDAVLYPNPGYPIYESQINFHGGEAIPYKYIPHDNGFQIDRDNVELSLKKNVRLLIYNNYQNPIGATSAKDEMLWLANLAKKYNLYVLSDEAYYNIQYTGKANSIISIPGMLDRTVILYTFSKTYAMTGWRVGAAIGPEKLMNIFSRLAVNDESCTNHFIQYGAIEALSGDQEGARNILNKLKIRRDTLAKHLNEISGISFVLPNSTFYLFPDVTNMFEKLNCISYEDYRIKLLHETGISFCTREHFGSPYADETKKYVRFAYSGISLEKINRSMEKLKKFIANYELTTSV